MRVQSVGSSVLLAILVCFQSQPVLSDSTIPGVPIQRPAVGTSPSNLQIDDALGQWLVPRDLAHPASRSGWTPKLLPDVVGFAEDGQWSEVGPPFRISHAAVLDPATRRMIVWGGYGNSQELWCWSLDAKSWTRLHPTGDLPIGRGDVFGVLDPVGRRILFVDGTRYAADGETRFNEVWELTLDEPMAWRRLEPKGEIPDQRFGAAFIYDPVRHRVIMQGGHFANVGWTNETWALSLGPDPAWSQLHPPGPQPEGRYDHVAVYDSRRDRMIIQGGVAANDSVVWALPLGDSTAAWTAIDAGNSPGRREVHVAAYDSLTDRLIVVGGRKSVAADSIDVWRLSLSEGSRWEPILAEGFVPPNRADAAMIVDPEDRSLLLYGGGAHIASSCEIWRLPLDPPEQWTRVAPILDPIDAMWLPAVVYDERRHRMVVCGELLDPIDSLQVFTLDLDGFPEWKPLHATGSPPIARAGAAAIYDPVRDRVVVYGGIHQDDSGVWLLNDLWALELSGTPSWRRLQTWNNPYRGLVGSAAIYDPARDRMVLFGGRADEGITSATYTLSLGDSPEWSPLSVTGAPPPPRSGSALFYDARRDRAVLFGGTGSRYRLNDTWILPLNGSATWREAAASGDRPETREAFASIYDPVGDRLVINGGFVTDNQSWTYGEDFWAFSLADTTWSRLQPAGTAIPGRTHHSALYDPREDRMLVFGGRTWFDYAPELWSLDWHRPNAGNLVQLIGTELRGNALFLTWQCNDGASRFATLERLELTGSWTPVTRAIADTSGRWRFEDGYPRPNTRRAYRLVVERAEGPLVSDPAWVGPFVSSLAIQAAVRPNPVVGVEPVAWFALHNSGPATLEVFLVSGKRLGKIDLGALGPGTHTQSLQGLLGSRPGIYLVRVTQGEASTTCKMVQL